MTSTAIVEFNEFEANLGELKQRYGNVYDLTDPKVEKQARSDRLAVSKVISRLKAVHKELKAPLLEQTRILDGEKSRIEGELVSVRDGIQGQIDKRDAEIKAAEEALKAKVAAIHELGNIDEHTCTSTDVRARLQTAEELVIDDSYGVQELNAIDARAAVIHLLGAVLGRVIRREEQAAELDRLKAELAAKEQAERDELIAREAREAAEREAREAQERELEALRKAEAARQENERLLEEKKAAKQRHDAEMAAKIQQDRIAAADREKEMARIAAEQAEQARQQAIEDAARAQAARKAAEKAEIEKREANKRHVANINRKAAQAIEASTNIDMSMARAIVRAIARGEVPAVTINY